MLLRASIQEENVLTGIAGERRSRRRYSLDLPVSFMIARGFRILHHGAGRTLNISSKGISIDIGEIVPLRAPIEVSVSWPARSNDSSPVELVLVGKVARSDGKSTVVRVVRHKFRAASLPYLRVVGSNALTLLATQ